jgi:hypothetical protein
MTVMATKMPSSGEAGAEPSGLTRAPITIRLD